MSFRVALQVFAKEQNAVIAGLPSLQAGEVSHFPTESSGAAQSMLDSLALEGDLHSPLVAHP